MIEVEIIRKRRKLHGWKHLYYCNLFFRCGVLGFPGEGSVEDIFERIVGELGDPNMRRAYYGEGTIIFRQRGYFNKFIKWYSGTTHFIFHTLDPVGKVVFEKGDYVLQPFFVETKMKGKKRCLK